MTTIDLPKTYDFKSTEERIYQWWEKKGYFQPTNDPKKPGFDPERKPYVISIPPPNITGELHLGSALFVSLEDLMIRYQRMKGDPYACGCQDLTMPASPLIYKLRKRCRREGTQP